MDAHTLCLRVSPVYDSAVEDAEGPAVVINLAHVVAEAVAIECTSFPAAGAGQLVVQACGDEIPLRAGASQLTRTH